VALINVIKYNLMSFFLLLSPLLARKSVFSARNAINFELMYRVMFER